MPNDLRFRVGTTVSLHTFSGTDAQVEASALRLCKSLGIAIDGKTRQQVLDDILAHYVDDIRRRVEAESVFELEAQQRVTNKQAARDANPL